MLGNVVVLICFSLMWMFACLDFSFIMLLIREY